MSFKNALTDVSICNDALGLLAQTSITSMTDSGLAARECRRLYPQTVGLLLEKHHFGIATRRANLVATDTIGTLQWVYTYLLPEDAAHVVRIAYPREMQNTSYYAGLKAQLDAAQQKFAVEGRYLYTNVVNASVDYVSFNITEADFTESFAEAVRLRLASKLAMPIAKRKDLRDEYDGKAEQHLNAILAREANAANPTYGDEPSEADYARVGFYSGQGVPLW